MNRTTLIAATALALIAGPALADETPAELFGATHADASASPAARDMAINKLSGDDLDEKIVPVQSETVTRGVSIGTQQLLTNLGVEAGQYSRAELAKMFIGRYD